MAGRSCSRSPNGPRAARSRKEHTWWASRPDCCCWCCSWEWRCSTTCPDFSARTLKNDFIQGIRLKIWFATFCAVSSLWLAAPAFTQEENPVFTVGDIRLEGLQRVTEGTVFNYLPINIGDSLTPQRVREAIRALYETG